MKLSRAQSAVTALLAALVAGPAGAAVQWGLGAALLLLCGLLLLVALLVGWDA